MSLAIGVVQKDFVIATSDTAVTYFPHDEELLEKTGEYVSTGEMIPTDSKSEKTHRISNKVILLSCGSSYLTEIFHVELSSRVKRDDDLSNCRKVSKEVLENLLNRKVYNKEKILSALREKLGIPDEAIREMKENFDELVSYLIPASGEINELVTNFTAYLIGFNTDGTTGMVDVRGDSYLNGPKSIKSGYPVLIDGHHPGYNKDQRFFSEYQKALILPSKNRNVDNFIQAITLVHAKISSESPVNVSSDCNFHIFTKNDNSNIDYSSFVFDTSPLHEQFKLQSG